MQWRATGASGTVKVMTTQAAAAAGYRLRVGNPARLAVSVTLAPHESMLALLRQAAGGPVCGAPVDLVPTIRRRLRATTRFALPALGPAGAGLLPDCATPVPPPAEVPVAVQADRLRQLPGATLQAELHAAFGSAVPAGWRAAADRPQRWLHALAGASLDAWGVSERRWRDAGPLLDREVRRVGIAVVRGGLDALLNTLHPRIRYAAGVLSLAGACDREVDLGVRRLVLLPMIAGPGAVFACFDSPEVACLAYPLRGPDGAGDADALTLVIGAPRAAILRLLRHPRTIHELARAVRCAPNTASYHCQQLETAGLVTRRRDRRVVRVTRTARGAELLDLLSG
jgi:DNA-binding transcriptional ArsR family regulator